MTRSTLLSLLALCSTVTVHAQQVVPVSSGTGDQGELLLGDPRPEPEWDVTGLLMAGTDVAVIVRNDDASDPLRASAVQTLAKDLFAEVVVDEFGVAQTTSGPLGSAIASGTLGALEIDLFDEVFDPAYDPTPEPLASEMLGGRMEVVHVDASGTRHVAHLYAYDKDQYAARMNALSGVEKTVWRGDLIQTDDGGARSVYVTGTGNVFSGRVRSGGGLKIGGSEQTFEAPVFWDSGMLQLTTNDTSFAYMPLKMPAKAVAAAPAPLSWYQSLPQALEFSGDVTLLDDGSGMLAVFDGFQTWPAEGKVVITTGLIDVDGVGLSGSVTLIASGEISLSASSSLLQPAVSDLLAWSTGSPGGVTIGGSGNLLTGSLLAPQDVVRLNGSDNTLVGNVRAAAFKILGSGNDLSDGAW